MMTCLQQILPLLYSCLSLVVLPQSLSLPWCNILQVQKRNTFVESISIEIGLLNGSNDHLQHSIHLIILQTSYITVVCLLVTGSLSFASIIIALYNLWYFHAIKIPEQYLLLLFSVFFNALSLLVYVSMMSFVMTRNDHYMIGFWLTSLQAFYGIVTSFCCFLSWRIIHNEDSDELQLLSLNYYHSRDILNLEINSTLRSYSSTEA